MAKQQHKKRGPRPSWFQKQIERDGVEFLNRKSPLDIQREYLNIIRDIIRGNITPKDYQYLFDMKILSNVRNMVYDEYRTLSHYNAAMNYITYSMQQGINVLSMYQIDPVEFEKTLNMTSTKLNAYSILLYSIDSLIAFVQNPYPKTEEAIDSAYQAFHYNVSKFKFI